MLDSSARRQLDELGFLSLPRFIDPTLLQALRTRIDDLLDQEGARAGSEFKIEPGARRLANLVNKGRVFERVIINRDILACMAHVLGPRFKLSSLNARVADPGSEAQQPLHADSGAVADEHGYWVCNSVWMLDDFTVDNGAIRVIPGSHNWRKAPPAGLYDPYPGEELVTGRAGTVVIMNAHMWHGGTANMTRQPRRAMHAYYTRWDKPQQQYQKKLLSPAVQLGLQPQARAILALDDAYNDAVSSTGSGVSGFMQ